jgi:hypothetical protein
MPQMGGKHPSFLFRRFEVKISATILPTLKVFHGFPQLSQTDVSIVP